MINRELINPQSIVVVGGSNNVHKPGGRIVRNLLDGKYKGELCVVNAKETDVQGASLILLYMISRRRSWRSSRFRVNRAPR